MDEIISKDQQRVLVDLAYFASPFTQRWKYEFEWNESLKTKILFSKKIIKKSAEYDTVLN